MTNIAFNEPKVYQVSDHAFNLIKINLSIPLNQQTQNDMKVNDVRLIFDRDFRVLLNGEIDLFKQIPEGKVSQLFYGQ